MLNTYFLDFEAYYDREYSLKRLTPVEYVLDPRFQTIGCAIKPRHQTSFWLDGPDLPQFFGSLDPNTTSLVTHNAMFDMCIVAWRYGFIPRLMTDTMGIARACLGHLLKSVSLNSVMKHLGLGQKTGALSKVIGMDLAAIKAAGLYEEFVAYGLGDVEGCAGIWERFVPNGTFPAVELAIMDMVLRCAIQPRFMLDRSVLALHKATVQREKEELVAKAMLMGANDRSALRSDEQFAELLRQHGVEPPTKISKTTGQPAYAFAKTDAAMAELEEHPNPAVQILVSARMGVKTSLEESRTDRLISISNLTWQGNQQPAWMPMPLRYSGAHTHRLSGDWKLNVQNLPRGGNLRRALIAPPGHKVMAADESQIEARGVAELCGQEDLVAQFERDEDVYSLFASTVFGYPVAKATHPTERFVGKQAILGLGYGLGWFNFRIRLAADSRLQIGKTIELEPTESQRVVNTYRTKYYGIPRAWRLLNDVGIPVLAHGGDFTFGPCRFSKGEILLPSGLKLFYHDLHRNEDGDWWFTYGGKPKKLYGGALLENITQALARIVVMEAGLRIRMRCAHMGIWLNLQVHDELVYIVPDELVEAFRPILMEELVRRPAWWPRIPLAAECGIGLNYADAK